MVPALQCREREKEIVLHWLRKTASSGCSSPTVFCIITRGGAESRGSVVFTSYQLLIIWKERQGIFLFSTPLGWRLRELSQWRRTSGFAMAKSRESRATTEGIRVPEVVWRRLLPQGGSILSPRVFTYLLQHWEQPFLVFFNEVNNLAEVAPDTVQIFLPFGSQRRQIGNFFGLSLLFISISQITGPFEACLVKTCQVQNMCLDRIGRA